VETLLLRSINKFATFGVALAALFAVAAAADKTLEEPPDLLSKIRSRTAAHLSQLPNYVCHEVLNRSVRRGSTWNRGDTVEFEVAFVGRQELFSRPGKDRFGEKSIEELAPGTVSNNVLGSHIDMILASDSAEFRFAGTQKKDGRKTFRYDLKVSQEKSGFRVKHGGAEAIVPYEGSIWVDAETLDLVRADLKVNRIPSYVGVSSIEKSLHYKMIRIGDTDFLLPHNAEMTAVDDHGIYSLNMVSIDGCREFTGESIITYTGPAQGTASRDRPDQK
jgi:hypothetical protein